MSGEAERSSPIRIDDGNNEGGDREHPFNSVATYSCELSRFDPPLPKIKDEGDLDGFISKNQDAFLMNMVVELGAKDSSSAPCLQSRRFLVAANGCRVRLQAFFMPVVTWLCGDWHGDVYWKTC
ncbi:hypothetical protein F0562_022380 [Nyssa sinensis]|uniref:Uncharacterized protein n=1 Tax=Nyssa sinensis TaxID=561372 RepID=A0A5J5BRE9_9ASTE|nr:hypothetical protein F0562_022380 [Nyssa sinensis]